MQVPRRDRPRSRASARPSSRRSPGRSELQLACEAVKAAIDDAGLQPSRRRRHGHLHDGHERRDRDRAQRRHRRPDVLQPCAPRRRGGGGHRGAGRDGRGDRHRRRRGLLPRVQRAFRIPVRRRRRRATDGRDAAVHGELRAVRADDARGVGRPARPALHVDLRRHQRGLRPRSRSSTAPTRRAIPTRGSTSGRSRSRTTRTRGGSSNPCCGCSTAARRATAASRSSSPAPSVRAIFASRPR